MASVFELYDVDPDSLGVAAGGAITLELASGVPGAPGAPGSPGPNLLSSTTTIGTLSPLSGSYSLLGLNAAGTSAGALSLSSTVRSLLGAADAAAARSAIGAGAPYTLPIASADSLGGVRVGANLSIDPVTGILSASGGGAWGSITGTLSSQTDLNTALNARALLGSANTFTAAQTIPSLFFPNSSATAFCHLNAASPTSVGNNQLGFAYFNNNQVHFGFYSGARIQFLGSGPQAQMVGTWTFPPAGLYPSPNLGADNGSGNDVRLAITKTGNGASQTVFASTQRFSTNGDQPALRMVSNGWSVWTRGTAWNDIGGASRIIEVDPSGNLGFFGVAPVARQTLPPAGTVTAADIRSALISLGLCQ